MIRLHSWAIAAEQAGCESHTDRATHIFASVALTGSGLYQYAVSKFDWQQVLGGV